MCAPGQITRTTLDIDETLLDAVCRKLGARTKTEAIEAALREVARSCTRR